jgi:hypothetical protein
VIQKKRQRRATGFLERDDARENLANEIACEFSVDVMSTHER